MDKQLCIQSGQKMSTTHRTYYGYEMGAKMGMDDDGTRKAKARLVVK